jgi:hypothetical protein
MQNVHAEPSSIGATVRGAAEQHVNRHNSGGGACALVLIEVRAGPGSRPGGGVFGGRSFALIAASGGTANGTSCRF